MSVILPSSTAHEYSEYVGMMNELWAKLRGPGPAAKVVDGLYTSRGYSRNRKGLRNTLEEVDMAYLFPSVVDALPHSLQESMLSAGMLDSRGRVLLEGRYVIPIRDFFGGIVAFVGWWDDRRKYITCGGKWFSKSKMWFGLEQSKLKLTRSKYKIDIASSKPASNKPVGDFFASQDEPEITAVCEGIFDTLSLRGCGIETYGAMGLTASPTKVAQLKYVAQGSTALGIPDQDEPGESVVKRDLWGLRQIRGKYIRWNQNALGKDVDDLISQFGESSVKDILIHAAKSKKYINHIEVKE